MEEYHQLGAHLQESHRMAVQNATIRTHARKVTIRQRCNLILSRYMLLKPVRNENRGFPQGNISGSHSAFGLTFPAPFPAVTLDRQMQPHCTASASPPADD